MKLFDLVSNTTTGDDLLRENARKWIIDHGFPTRSSDTWYYTNLNEILSYSFLEHYTNEGLVELSRELEELKGNKLVFVDCRYSNLLSTIITNNGLKISILDNSEYPIHDNYSDGFRALNILKSSESIYIEIQKNAIIEELIHLVFISSTPDIVNNPRVTINASNGSKCSITEHYICSKNIVYFTNASVDLILEQNTTLDHCKVQNESISAFHISRLNVKQDKLSSFTSNVISLGAKLSRSEVDVYLGQNANANLNGVYLTGMNQCHDNQVMVEHFNTHSMSSEIYKGVIGKGGYGIFDGLISVCENAIKTDAIMSNKNLLLSDDAHVSSRPRLEILNDDVKCSHGVTTGKIDELLMLYMRTRGISREDAMVMITESFVGEIVSFVKICSLREYIKNIVSDKLQSLSLVK